MKRMAALVTTGMMTAGVGPCDPATTVDPAALALHHAPVHYQDTDDSWALADEITAFDYDGNWDGLDNWDNLEDPSTWTTGNQAVVYQSVVETCTHWYVVYMMYHPRDWTDLAHADVEHENDAEGVLAVITKDGTSYGRLDAMVTVSHLDFYSYTPENSAYTGVETIDGTVSFTDVDGVSHPMTSQEPRGHGLRAWPYTGDFSGEPGEDGITYLPGTVAEAPPTPDSRDVRYALVDLYTTLWPLQLFGGSPYDGNWGNFQGDDSGTCGNFPTTPMICEDDAANSPWTWNDGNDDVPKGAMAFDPALLVERYFNDRGTFSRDYVSNRYLENLRNSGYTDDSPPPGFPDEFSLDDAYTHLDADCP